MLIPVLLALWAVEPLHVPHPTADTAKPGVGQKLNRHAANVATEELFQNVVVEPSKPTTLESTLDYSKQDKVAVSMTGDDDLSSLTIQAQWSVPDAERWAVVETKSGKSFPFTNTGGGVFQTFGSQFRLVLRTSGDVPLKIHQITVFCRGQ